MISGIKIYKTGYKCNRRKYGRLSLRLKGREFVKNLKDRQYKAKN